MRTILVLGFWLTMLCFPSPMFSQWIVQHSGLPASLNPTLILSAVDSNVCWGVQSDIQVGVSNPKGVVTTDGGDHWSLIQLPVSSGLKPVSIAALNKDTAWIALYDSSQLTSGGIFKTTDGGLSWIKQSSAFPGAGGNPDRIYFFDADNGLCTGQPRNGYWEIYTTSDGGTNWTRVPSADIPAMEPGDRLGPGTGADNSFWFNTASCSVYRTTDRGYTWTVTRHIYPSTAYYLELAFRDSLNGMANSYYGDEINKVSRSTDGGATWTALPAPPSSPSYAGIRYIPGTSGTYMVTSMKNIGYPEPASPGSVFTPDDGLTWIPVDNLAHGSTVFISNKTGWSAGCGDTIFKWHGYPLGIGPLDPPDRSVTLSQNYPNPFYSTTSIQFRITGTSKVILKVYDIRGSEVATLVNEEKSAGSYKVNFESGGLSSGIYYYRLQAGNFMQTKKLCIL
jgi:photosystem II stability/assembly factor-like uncharacterized protein